jgi:acid phosphatase
MQDGSIAQGDAWLGRNLSGYAAWAKANNSLLVITWDQDDNSGNKQVPTIFYGDGVKTGLAARAPAIKDIWA